MGRRPEVLEAAASEIEAEVVGSSLSWFKADVTDPTAVETLAEHIRATHGTLDAIVNNAGGGGGAAGPDLATLSASWRAIYEQNVISAVMLTHGLAPLLRRPGGRIVLVSSMASRSGGGGGAYVAAKGALNTWVLSLTNEFAPQGITSNVVAPGYTPDTELFGPGLPPRDPRPDRLPHRPRKGWSFRRRRGGDSFPCLSGSLVCHRTGHRCRWWDPAAQHVSGSGSGGGPADEHSLIDRGHQPSGGVEKRRPHEHLIARD